MGIVVVYGVSQEALGHDVRFPPGYTGSPFAIHTDQLELCGKVSHTHAQPVEIWTRRTHG